MLKNVYQAIGKLQASMENLEKELLGNGQPGVRQRVESLEGNQAKVVGGGLVLSGLLAIWQAVHAFFHH